jgi:ABC-2 type transport system ATP-binding protein
MKALSVHEVRRAYVRGCDVLRGVTFSLQPGEVVGLLGRNGAGKTTLIRTAMGMMAPHGGRVELFGVDPRRDPLQVRRRVGYVSEEQILPPFLSVRDVIDLHRELYPSWDNALAAELGVRFQLSPRARIRTLSRGEARQVALLCAVAHRPELLLLDEPAGGLDPVARREFLETAIQVLNETGTAILFSSHYLFDVERLAQRVVLLHEGEVLLDAPLDDLREEYSLALISRVPGLTLERLRALDGCLAARERAGALRAIFRSGPGATEALLDQALEDTSVHCRHVALEEMFIELVGGQL